MSSIVGQTASSIAGQRRKSFNPSGSNSSNLTAEEFAGENLSALKVVYQESSELFIADPEFVTVYQIIGITTTAGTSGSPITFQYAGFISDPSFSFVPGPVWLGSDGTITQVPPTSGWNVVLGTAISFTELYIDLRMPVKIED